jgi:hypothetical protein
VTGRTLTSPRARFPLSARSAETARSYQRLELELADGRQTTLHVATFDLAATRTRVVSLGPEATLLGSARERGWRDAIVGGFFIRPHGIPLGELRIGGRQQAAVPFAEPWNRRRACVHVSGASVRIALRPELDDQPAGDLLQAGPLLVRGGIPVFDPAADGEGFSAGAHQFDSDITRGRYPRAALGVGAERIFAVVGDGRSSRDAGLRLSELAAAMAELGAQTAINLDGGGSASLVYGGRLRNRPREEHGIEILGGRPIATALVFEPQAPRPIYRLVRRGRRAQHNPAGST